jgi:TatD DNase family protein
MIEVLQSLNRPIVGTVHCYTSNWEHAQKYLNLGLFLGFTGVVTFPPKKLDPGPQNNLLEVLEKMPIDRMVVETDSPYLAAQAYRGQRAEPWMVEEVVKKIALIRQISSDEMSKILLQNTLRLFPRIQV